MHVTSPFYASDLLQNAASVQKHLLMLMCVNSAQHWVPGAGETGGCGVHLDGAPFPAVEGQADRARGGAEWGHPSREPGD